MKIDELTFHMNNGSFESGDAEYLYNLIRLKKPTKIIEIGSGNSTLMAIKAITKNQEEIVGYKCKHVCIEPYEAPWLEKTGVTIIRQRVEEVNKAMFSDVRKRRYIVYRLITYYQTSRRCPFRVLGVDSFIKDWRHRACSRYFFPKGLFERMGRRRSLFLERAIFA